MSLASKTTLTLSCIVSVGIIGYVHLKQQTDREKLHEGVLRDIERRQKIKTENNYLLEKQKELTNKYESLEESQTC